MNQIARRFAQTFWGLFLVHFNFSINQFDLLPDFLGYLLIAIGLGGLAEVSQKFSTASKFAWFLLPTSLIAMVDTRPFAVIVHLVALILGSSMMWFLLGGIIEFTSVRHRLDLAERAGNRRLAFVVCLFAGFVANVIGPPAAIFVVLAVVCWIVLTILILHLIHRVKNELCT